MSVFRFTCQLNVVYFPFDWQNCTMVFGSWTGTKAVIDYQSQGDDVCTEAYVHSEEWAVRSFHIVRHEVPSDC